MFNTMNNLAKLSVSCLGDSLRRLTLSGTGRALPLTETFFSKCDHVITNVASGLRLYDFQ